MRTIQIAIEKNEAMREIVEKRRRFQLTSVREFIGPLPRPIRLLNEDVREGRRGWALPYPFLGPLYRRDIVSPLPVPHHLQQYLVGMWEH